MRQHHALGTARRAGRVENDRDVAPTPASHLVFEESGVTGVVRAPLLRVAIEALEEWLRVVAQAASVVVEDYLKRPAALLDLQQLVHLLLVLGDSEADLRLLERVDHFLGDRVLVEGDRDSAEALGRGHGPVEPRAVVPDDREAVAAPEAPGRQAGRSRGLRVPRPRPALPDAEVLLDRGPVPRTRAFSSRSRNVSGARS